MRVNRPAPPSPPVTNYGGSPAQRGESAIKLLRRTCLSALLFEDMFYESGSEHAKSVASLVTKCAPEEVAALAIQCREQMYLRHMPLFLVRELARERGNGPIVAATLEKVIQRPDELTEYLAMYWRNQKDEAKSPLSAGSKRGLALALKKFDPDTLAKYDRPHEYKLRDVLRLVHPKPSALWQKEAWGKLLKGELESPDTWEVALSAGKDKKATFERLLRERKLGGLAFLRNLRNMQQAGVDEDLIRERFEGGFGKVLPFRFVAALKYAPAFLQDMNRAMKKCLQELPQLGGTTGVLVDVSGSMVAKLSEKSDMDRIDAAAALAMLVAGVAQRTRLWTFTTEVVEVPAEASLTLITAIQKSQPNGWTHLKKAIQHANQAKLDRLIVFTDEQSQDGVCDPAPGVKGYMVNVANYKRGVRRSGWTHIDGFSERILDFILEEEAADKRGDPQ